MIILLDNGHGIDTRGKCSPDKRLLEWRYTRDIVVALSEELLCEGIDTRILVPENGDVPLSERCRRAAAICRSVGNDNVALISIHVNAAGNDGQWHGATGWEAFTSPGKTRADTLAEYLYSAAGFVLSPLLSPEIGSRRPVKILRTDLSDGDRDKEARFKILVSTPCPAVLTENLFQDNREDVDFLLSPVGRNAIVSLHKHGILNYIRHTANP